MKPNGPKYYLVFLILCLVSFLVSLSLSKTGIVYFTTNHYWIPTLFFAVSTLVINFVMFKGTYQPKDFVFKALALSMGRLLLCMVFALMYMVIYKNQALAFTSHFMMQYILFTVFEISITLKYIKHTN